MAWPVIGALAGLGATVAGAVSSNNQTAQQRADVDKQLDNQFEQDKKVYEYNWKQSLREYEYLLEGVNIKRDEEEMVGQLKDQLAIDQYNYNKASQDLTYLNELRQFNESEKIYGRQLSFNQVAAQQAASAERDKLRETLIASAFEQQDMVVELLQQEGAMQARGVSGRSIGKQLQGAMALFGRNQAVLAESLISARRQTDRNLERIGIEKYGADLAAEANRKLAVIKGPDIPVPYRTPRATFQDPLKPEKGPKPVRGVNTAARSSSLGIAATSLSAGINAGNQIYNFYNPSNPIG